MGFQRGTNSDLPKGREFLLDLLRSHPPGRELLLLSPQIYHLLILLLYHLNKWIWRRLSTHQSGTHQLLRRPNQLGRVPRYESWDFHFHRGLRHPEMMRTKRVGMGHLGLGRSLPFP